MSSNKFNASQIKPSISTVQRHFSIECIWVCLCVYVNISQWTYIASHRFNLPYSTVQMLNWSYVCAWIMWTHCIRNDNSGKKKYVRICHAWHLCSFIQCVTPSYIRQKNAPAIMIFIQFHQHHRILIYIWLHDTHIHRPKHRNSIGTLTILTFFLIRATHSQESPIRISHSFWTNKGEQRQRRRRRR